MTLTRRVRLTALVLALPAALLATTSVEWLRARDMRLALERIVDSHLTDVTREACESDPGWFLAGPRRGRPSRADRLLPDADVNLPRPNADPLPIDVFAYDDAFSPTSTAGPRFPTEFRNAMRGSPPTARMFGSYESPAGTGIQIAQLTGWSPGPCAVLLVRMQPRPGIWAGRMTVFGLLTAVFVAVGLAAVMPTVRRVKKLSHEAGASAAGDFEAIAPDESRDEVSRMAFVFNDAATAIRQRSAEIADRAEALRRLVSITSHDVAAPLARLETQLAELAVQPAPTDIQMKARATLQDTHDVSMRLNNLMAAAELRMTNDPLPIAPGDVAAIAREVATRLEPLAKFRGVILDVSIPVDPIMTKLHAGLAPLAIDNAIDNAIRYNQPGGRAEVRLEPRETGEVFSLRVTSRGRDVSDEEFKGLAAIRRFRGDESWNRRPNAPGLGLAVAREIADRTGWQLELRRPPDGGLEVEFTGGQEPKRT